MLCQSCGKRQATTHVKTIINGELKEYELCSECANKMGYGSFFGNMGFDLDKLFGSFMDSFPTASRAYRKAGTFGRNRGKDTERACKTQG